jgi:HSP20 family protein
MALPTSPATSWMQNLDFPSTLFESGGTDYELYEEDGEFVLSVELPGFDVEEIDVHWDDGILNVAAEHVDEGRNQKKTYHRRFRFPKQVAEDDIDAEYHNGVLEVTLPVMDEAVSRGRQIEIEG